MVRSSLNSEPVLVKLVTWRPRDKPRATKLLSHVSYSPFPRRQDSKWSSEYKTKSRWSKFKSLFNMSNLKRYPWWPSRISFCIQLTISSLIFSGTDCRCNLHDYKKKVTGNFSAVGSARGCPSLGRRFDSVYRPYHVTRSFVVHNGFPVRVRVTPHRWVRTNTGPV